MFSFNELSPGQLTASRHELIDLARSCLANLSNTYIVIDAVDECQKSSDLVRGILNAVKSTAVKVAFFSRPNISGLSKAIKEARRINVGRATSKDIGLFFSRRMEEYIAEKILPNNAEAEKDRLIEYLVNGADGMFLWARLMASHLQSPALTPLRRIALIKSVSLPEGLEEMYDRIVQLIDQSIQVERELAKRILMVLTYSKRNLTATELQELSRLNDGSATEEGDDFENFAHTVTMTCAGLVELVKAYDRNHPSGIDSYRFIHLSAKEYFLTNSSDEITFDTDHLCFHTITSHAELARSCLQYLLYQVPAQPLSGGIGSSITLEFLNQRFPFCSYAAMHWASHLLEACPISSTSTGLPTPPWSSANEKMLRYLTQFLSQKLVLTAWIEACYIVNGSLPLKVLHACAKSLSRLGLPSHHSIICDDICELVAYLDNLTSSWGSRLAKRAGLIWEEVTAFNPHRLLQQTSSVSYKPLASRLDSEGRCASAYLCKISETTFDGRAVSILSVWPSR